MDKKQEIYIVFPENANIHSDMIFTEKYDPFVLSGVFGGMELAKKYKVAFYCNVKKPRALKGIKNLGGHTLYSVIMLRPYDMLPNDSVVLQHTDINVFDFSWETKSIDAKNNVGIIATTEKSLAVARKLINEYRGIVDIHLITNMDGLILPAIDYEHTTIHVFQSLAELVHSAENLSSIIIANSDDIEYGIQLAYYKFIVTFNVNCGAATLASALSPAVYAIDAHLLLTLPCRWFYMNLIIKEQCFTVNYRQKPSDLSL